MSIKHFCIGALVSSPIHCFAAQDIVLPPNGQAASGQPAKALVIVPGGKIEAKYYETLGREIQLQSKENLWVVIPSFHRTGNICLAPDQGPWGGSAVIDGAIKKLEDQAGSIDSRNMFVAGHSAGAICAPAWAQSHPNIGGMIMYAGYPLETLSKYTYPLLVLGGDRDPTAARPSRMAQYYQEFQDFKGDHHLRILEGINHSSFSPGYSHPGDLPVTKKQYQMVLDIAEVTVDFIENQEASSYKPTGPLAKAEKFTDELLHPYVTLDVFTASGQVCVEGQKILGLGLNSFNTEVQLTTNKPEFTFAHTSFNEPSDTVSIVSLASKEHDCLRIGTKLTHQDVACKMVSGERLASMQKSVTVPQTSCRDIQRYMAAMAWSRVPPRIFSSRDKLLNFSKDSISPIAPAFVLFSKVEWKSLGSVGIALTSPSVFTPLDAPVYPGNHYCKIVAPDTIYDWLISESLKS